MNLKRKCEEQHVSESGSDSDSGKTNNRKRRRWYTAEDKTLAQAVQDYTDYTQTDRISWAVIAQKITNRTPKQCRDRWNCICPGIKKRVWTSQEDDLLIRLQKTYQNSWVQISKWFEGRNDNMVKSRFRLLKQLGLHTGARQTAVPVHPIDAVAPASACQVTVDKPRLTTNYGSMNKLVAAVNKVEYPSFAAGEEFVNRYPVQEFVETDETEFKEWCASLVW